MINRLKAIEKYLVIVFLFLLPTQLAFHFWPDWAFVFGIRVDYLAPAIYLTDILVLMLVILNFKVFQIFRKHFLLVLFVLLLAIINCVFSTSPFVSIYKWIKLLELVFVACYFSQQKILSLGLLIKVVFYSLIAFSFIGIVQFVIGGTIGGLLYFLGERSFNLTTPGIALATLGGVDYMRAYSTFSHPNSMAGFLGVGLLFVLLSGKLKKNLFNIIGAVIVFVSLFLSFSLSSYLGMFIAFIYLLLSKNKKYFNKIINLSLIMFILVSILLSILSPWILKNSTNLGQEIVQRLNLAYISGQMINQKFLIGQGLGTFIVNIPEQLGIISFSWLLQPVHNIYLLVFSEVGMVGLLLFSYLIYKTSKGLLLNKKIYLLIPLVFILFTGLFDHYSLTLQQNTFILAFIIGNSLSAKG